MSVSPNTITFHTVLGGENGGPVGIVVPEDAMVALGPGKRYPVIVSIGDYRYRNTVGWYKGAFRIAFSAENRAAAGVVGGPMHVDSILSANIQFADWIAAAATRAIDYQLIESSVYEWVTSELAPLRNGHGFTYESKLHLHQRAIPDINSTELFSNKRRLFPSVAGQRVSATVDPAVLRRIYGAAQNPHNRK